MSELNIPPPPINPPENDAPPTAKVRQLLLVAFGSVLLGSFLPWVTVTAPFIGRISKNGIEGDGVITAVIAGLCLLQLILGSARGPKIPGATRWFGIALTGLCIYEIVDVYQRGSELEIGVVQVGVGLWLTAAGAALVLYLGFRFGEKAPTKARIVRGKFGKRRHSSSN